MTLFYFKTKRGRHTHIVDASSLSTAKSLLEIHLIDPEAWTLDREEVRCK